MLNYIILFAACFIACSADEVTPLAGSFNRYFVYTRASRNPIELDRDNVTASVDATRNTTFIVHGHGGSGTTSLNPDLKDAFLISGDLNVIVVDWSVYAGLPYASAVGAVPSVGAHIGTIITELIENEAATLNSIHLVGFDLGAHVVGFAGREIKDGRVARITGLNPSGNAWGSNSQRLRSGDAEYVEVIHTDGNGLLSYGVGEAIGDVDFFANGGSGQPGCLLNHLCSHIRSWELMAASLEFNQLVGNKCNNWLQVTLNTCRGVQLRMGNNELIKQGSGTYRVNTGWRYPF